MRITLNELLQFDHPGTRNRFKDKFGFSESESITIFKELLKWLWLNAKHENILKLKETKIDFPEYISIRTEQIVLDEMWHIFLQYTEDYEIFCNKYLNCWIGHSPNDTTVKIDPKNLKTHLHNYLSFVYDELGPETIKTWFADFPIKYSQIYLLNSQIKQLQKKIRTLESENETN